MKSKNDIFVAIIIAIAIIAGGTYLAYPGLNDRYEIASASTLASQEAIARDTGWINDFPRRRRDLRKKAAILRKIDITAPDGRIEQKFIKALDGIVRRNGIGMKPITFEEVFTPEAAPATPIPASTPGNMFDGPGGTPSANSAAAPDPARSAPTPPPVPVLSKTRVSVELIGTYAAVLETISELSNIPVLDEVTGIQVKRNVKDDGARNPMLDTTVTVQLYRAVKE